jgi:hypothetical protein
MGTEHLNMPEMKPRRAGGLVRAWADPELRALKARQTKSQWADPVVRAKRVEGMKRNHANRQFIKKLQREGFTEQEIRNLLTTGFA